LATVVVLYKQKHKLEKGFQNYTYYLEYLFAPIYEEVVFRGIIFGYLLTTFNTIEAIVISSILFGIWHFKNIFLTEKHRVIRQVIATGMLYGPVFAYITFLTGNIWLAVMLHYVNNLYYLAKVND